MIYRLDNRMRVDGCIQVHYRVKIGRQELRLHVPVVVIICHTFVLHIACKALIQPFEFIYLD